MIQFPRRFRLKDVAMSVFFCLLASIGFTQNATITGTVLDAEFKYPLPSAYVSISTVDCLMTSTDMDGRFSFSEVPIGRHVLTISFMG